MILVNYNNLQNSDWIQKNIQTLMIQLISNWSIC